VRTLVRCLTLAATGVYSGWVELRPTLNKAHKWVFEALLDIKSSLPYYSLNSDRPIEQLLFDDFGNNNNFIPEYSTEEPSGLPMIIIESHEIAV